MEKAKDKLQADKESILKNVRSEPITAETKDLKTENLKPFAEPIKEEETE